MASKKNSGKSKGAPKSGKNASKYDAQNNDRDLPAVEADPGDLPVVEKDPGNLPAVETDPEDLPAVETDPGDLPAVENSPQEPKEDRAQKLAADRSAGKSAGKAAEKVTEADNSAAGASRPGHFPEPLPPVGKISPRMPKGIEQRPVYGGNPYLPRMARVTEVIKETPNINTLRLVLEDDEAMENFVFEPGQVGQLSVFGAGEATFVINSPPSQKAWLQFSVMRAGEVTDALHSVAPGDKIGLRAPLGNFFPYNDWKGKNVFFIGGGIGMAPIRTIMLHLLEHKADYGKISLLYGARTPQDMAYSYELDGWKNNPDLDCTLCIDNPHENWEHKVGLIPKVLEELNPSPLNTVAVICGPPIMIKFTLQSLQKLGFEPQNIVTTLEKRMKCGIGICGRCNIGDRYVCVDGPVFTLAQLDGLPPDM